MRREPGGSQPSGNHKPQTVSAGGNYRPRRLTVGRRQPSKARQSQGPAPDISRRLISYPVSVCGGRGDMGQIRRREPGRARRATLYVPIGRAVWHCRPWLCARFRRVLTSRVAVGAPPGVVGQPRVSAGPGERKCGPFPRSAPSDGRLLSPVDFCPRKPDSTSLRNDASASSAPLGVSAPCGTARVSRCSTRR